MRPFFYMSKFSRLLGKSHQRALIALVGAICVALAVPGGVASAAPSTGQSLPHTVVITHTETLKLSASTCATLRKAMPQLTCVVVRTTTETDITTDTTGIAPSVIGGGGGGGCYSGDKTFHDNLWFVNGFNLAMYTDFHYNGSCGQPAGVNGPQCQVTSLPTGIAYEGTQCFYWHSSEFNATEGKFIFTYSVLKVGGVYNDAIYRGCDPTVSCYSGWV